MQTHLWRRTTCYAVHARARRAVSDQDLERVLRYHARCYRLRGTGALPAALVERQRVDAVQLKTKSGK
jgi:hypothetical protein